ncbi:MAG: hypothetical protein JOZ75_11365 [Candidatus Dormibacteraeota bacterium]|nr:hypothetical protein [Candidatus Dormibacteraeota bacterium]
MAASIARGPSAAPPFKPRLVDGTPVISEYAVPAGSRGPEYITEDASGNAWFTLPNSGQIGMATPSGTMTAYPIPSAWSDPTGIVLGPDGNLWFTEYAAGKVANITPSGQVTEYAVETGGWYGNPDFITSNAGALWFTYYQAPYSSGATAAGYIGEITTSGVVSRYQVPSSYAGLKGIATGPDGNVWFAESGTSDIGRITPAGQITEFAPADSSTNPPQHLAHPDLITQGPGGMWVTTDAGQVWSVATDGTSGTLHPLADGDFAGQLAAAADGGSMWFVDSGNNAVGQLVLGNGTGAVGEYTLTTSNAGPVGITAGSAGIWFTEESANKLASAVPLPGSARRTVEFVHGINGNWKDIGRPGGAWSSLLDPMRASGYNVSIFEDYQDAGDAVGGQCYSRSAPTLDLAPLYLNPGAYRYPQCDSESALALNAGLLFSDLQYIAGDYASAGPTTVIANSMGAAITRGYLALTQVPVITTRR